MEEVAKANDLNRARVSIKTIASEPITHTPQTLALSLLGKEFSAMFAVRQAQMEHLCRLLNARLDQGEKKYGMRLSTFMRGRNTGPTGEQTPLADAYDEALDLVTYCERVRREAVILKRWDLAHRATRMMRAVQPFLFDMLEGGDECSCEAIEAHITSVEKRAPLIAFLEENVPSRVSASETLDKILRVLEAPNALPVVQGKTIIGMAVMRGGAGAPWVLVSAMTPPSVDSVFDLDLGRLHLFWIVEAGFHPVPLPPECGWQDAVLQFFKAQQHMDRSIKPLIIEWEV